MSNKGDRQFVIIGGGLAGAKAAQTLREEGFEGGVTIIAAEQERPYVRPPLSKGYLQGGTELHEVYVHPDGWYQEHDVDLRLDVAASRIDRAAKRIDLVDGRRQPYDKLLIATGATPRPLPVDGADLDGVHYLRTLADSQALRAAFGHAGDVVVIGAGWIGLETAAAARKAGCAVTVVEPEQAPLSKVLGPLGGIFADVHRENGVRLRLGAKVAALRGDGHVREVVLDSGEVLPADDVIVGIGAAPNVELAREAGLEVNSGIVTGASLRTADPDIFAAGDVAEAFHPTMGRHLRVEHWANALNQGPVAARSMLGQDVSYDRVPYFYTDQFEIGMEFSGDVTGHDEILIRGAELEFIAFWLRQGEVIAGMNVNVWDVVPAIQDLIRTRRLVDPKRLVDPEVPLGDV